ncbi:MAG: SAM-dependent methyltransferase [Gammaproteobacteria bacterium]|nr:MAG: SAM-dependent methyltransferase [Gammaproteobacteria bacterium]
MAFQDHFSSGAKEYSAYRPRYGPDLYRYLATIAPENSLAWDCGTGNGQAAVGLAEHFERVCATDPSQQQIQTAPVQAGVEYRVAEAEVPWLADASVDLVTAAQAAHWFDLNAFYREVRRVLRPGGAIALWCYRLVSVSPEVDAVVQHYHAQVVGPYWPPERALVDAGYSTLEFPFEELQTPGFHIEVQWDLSQLAGYLGTWSAAGRYRDAKGCEPLDEVFDDLAAAWGEEKEKRTVRWPLSLRVGRLPGAAG